MIDPIRIDSKTLKIHYFYNGVISKNGYKNRTEAAKAYVNEMMAFEPKYKPLLHGKSWPEIFKIVGIKI